MTIAVDWDLKHQTKQTKQWQAAEDKISLHRQLLDTPLDILEKSLNFTYINLENILAGRQNFGTYHIV